VFVAFAYFISIIKDYPMTAKSPPMIRRRRKTVLTRLIRQRAPERLASVV
jgi:hypothetical protein